MAKMVKNGNGQLSLGLSLVNCHLVVGYHLVLVTKTLSNGMIDIENPMVASYLVWISDVM